MTQLQQFFLDSVNHKAINIIQNPVGSLNDVIRNIRRNENLLLLNPEGPGDFRMREHTYFMNIAYLLRKRSNCMKRR